MTYLHLAAAPSHPAAAYFPHHPRRPNNQLQNERARSSASARAAHAAGGSRSA